MSEFMDGPRAASAALGGRLGNRASLVGYGPACAPPRRTCPARTRPRTPSTGRSRCCWPTRSRRRCAGARRSSSAIPRTRARSSSRADCCSSSGAPRPRSRGSSSRVRIAIDAGNLPLAVAAVGGSSRDGGRTSTQHLDAVAARLLPGLAAPPGVGRAAAAAAALRGLPAAQLLPHRAGADVQGDADPPRGDAGLRARPRAPSCRWSRRCRSSARCPRTRCASSSRRFEMITVPGGQAVISEGEEGAEAYIVARGELEVVAPRQADDDGRAAHHARAPVERRALRRDGAAVARAARGERHRDAAVDPARGQARGARGGRARGGPSWASSSRRTAAGAWWRTWRSTSPVLVAVPPQERAMLVERFETRIFEKGDKLVNEGEDAQGLHLVASGEVAVVAPRGRRVDGARDAACRATRWARWPWCCGARRTRTSRRCTPRSRSSCRARSSCRSSPITRRSCTAST